VAILLGGRESRVGVNPFPAFQLNRVYLRLICPVVV